MKGCTSGGIMLSIQHGHRPIVDIMNNCEKKNIYVLGLDLSTSYTIAQAEPTCGTSSSGTYTESGRDSV
jgi:hypothetical protein